MGNDRKSVCIGNKYKFLSQLYCVFVQSAMRRSAKLWFEMLFHSVFELHFIILESSGSLV